MIWTAGLIALAQQPGKQTALRQCRLQQEYHLKVHRIMARCDFEGPGPKVPVDCFVSNDWDRPAAKCQLSADAWQIDQHHSFVIENRTTKCKQLLENKAHTGEKL